MADVLGRPGNERRDTRTREEQLETVVREFDDLRGLSLTPTQAARLFRLAPERCERVLAELVDRGFLEQRRDGQYARRSAQDQ